MSSTLFINSDPEGILVAQVGCIFYRRGDRYFMIDQFGREEQLFNVTKEVFFRKKYNPDFYKKYDVQFGSTIETWFKVANNGSRNGWQFISYQPPTFVGEQVIPPTPTPMASFTPTPTVTPTPTPSSTPIETPTPTPSPTVTVTPSSTEIIGEFSMYVSESVGLTVYFNGFTPFDTIPTWSFGDGSPEVNDWFPTTHSYSAYGTYQITASTTDFTGSIVSASDEVTLVAPSAGTEFFAVGYAAGAGTNFMKSSDGVNWSTRYVDNQGQLIGLEVGRNTLVALEGGYTSEDQPIDPSSSYADIHVSTDLGETWSTCHHSDFFPTGGHSWADIVYAGDKFIALSEQGAAIISNDNGLSWTASAEIFGSSLKHAATYNGIIVQLSSGFYSGSDYVNHYHAKVSHDAGLTWQGAAATVAGSGSNFDRTWTGICVDETGFTAVAPESTGSIMYSSDGMQWDMWTDESGSNLPIYGFDIAYGHAGYVVVTGESSVVWTISAATNWTAVENSGSLPADGRWKNVTYGNGVYVAVSDAGNSSIPSAMYSTNGVDWTTGSGMNNQTEWADIKHAVVVGTGKYLLDASSYSYLLGTIPPRSGSVGYSNSGANLALDGTVYIWKVEGDIESGSIICTNVRTLIGKIDTTAVTSSMIDITDILARETYGPSSSIVFTTIGTYDGHNYDLMTNSSLEESIGNVSERFIRQIPYLTAGNAGSPSMLTTYDDTHYQIGSANFATGIQILNFESDGALIRLSNGYPTDIQFFEFSQDPIVRYTLNTSNLESILYVPSESFNGLIYYPSGALANGSQINIWKVSGSIVSGSLLSYISRSLVDTIYTYNYSDTSSIDITSTVILNSDVGVTRSGLVFTTTGEFSSTQWEIMTSASVINTSGSIETIGVHAIPHGDFLRMVEIQDTGSGYLVGEVGFAGGILFPSTYNGFATVVLSNGYSVPPPYIELSPTYSGS